MKTALLSIQPLPIVAGYSWSVCQVRHKSLLTLLIQSRYNSVVGYCFISSIREIENSMAGQMEE